MSAYFGASIGDILWSVIRIPNPGDGQFETNMGFSSGSRKPSCFSSCDPRATAMRGVWKWTFRTQASAQVQCRLAEWLSFSRSDTLCNGSFSGHKLHARSNWPFSLLLSHSLMTLSPQSRFFIPLSLTLHFQTKSFWGISSARVTFLYTGGEGPRLFLPGPPFLIYMGGCSALGFLVKVGLAANVR